jgi:ketosteroid isomerase-like protein
MDEPVLDAHRQRNFDAIQRVFAAVSAGDADAQVANYTEDITLEFPFTDPPTIVEGRAAVHERLTNAFKVFQFTLALTGVHPCVDADEFIVEFIGSGTYLPNGAPYENRYIAVFGFRDGMIYRQREYFDPTQAAKSASA